MYLAHLNWREADVVLKKKDLVTLIVLGSTEQHGAVGLLGTDFIIPDYMARRIDERTEVLVTPTMPFGVAPHHTSFAGTIDIGADGLYCVVKGMFKNLMAHGARKFVILNGHGGNDPVLEKVALETFREGGLCAQINWWALAPVLNPKWVTGHGDAQEVAMIRAIDENLIKMDQLIPFKLNHMSDNLINTYLNQVQFKNAGVKVTRDVRSTVSTGGFGGLDPSLGTVEWGREMGDAVIDYCVDFINEFRNVDLEKAHAKA